MVKTRGKRNRYALLIIVVVGFFLFLILKGIPEKKKREPPRLPDIERIQPEEKPQEREVEKWRIAVIIDDVGYPTENMNAYLSFRGKLSFSVLPFLGASRRYAEALKSRGFEVMIHIPMEPLSYPQNDPGPGALFMDDPEEEVLRKLSLMIRENPFAKGANNHMGSKATQYQPLMLLTLDTLKNHNLFFIDSYTSDLSIAFHVAQHLNMPASRRDVFLDNEDSFSSINHQFEKLKRIARMKGTSIGIGHIQRENTLKVLNYQLPLLERENYALVFASEAVRN